MGDDVSDSPSPPQPVDPYAQAAAQYGLSTGTALFNAGLNRTNSVNPLGSTTWSASYPGATQAPQSGLTSPSASGPGAQLAEGAGNRFNIIPSSSSSAPTGPTGTVPFGGSQNGFGFGGTPVSSGFPSAGGPSAGLPYNGSPTGSPSGGAPTYTQYTSLAPQFQSQLEKPIDTSGIAGMPGGPSTTQDLQNTQDALYKNQMQYLQPEQDLASEQLKSQLANEGITPGSAAYNNEMGRLSREQEFAKSNARTQAIAGGGQEQSRLFGLGSQSLQDELAARNAPISEWAALNGTGGASAQALTPDISGAFGQQYQGQLAGYNANVSSNNQTESSLASLAIAAAMFFSDRRLKENIKRVGKTDEGLPVYTYNYKGDTRAQMGVMAQDVEKVKPEAVFGFGGPEGPKMVDYRQVT